MNEVNIMEVLLVILIFTLIFTVTFLGHWIDNKYNVQVVRWMNCEVSSPFKNSAPKSNVESPRPKAEYDDLRERIEILEKIVTDSSWELNQKLKNL